MVHIVEEIKYWWHAYVAGPVMNVWRGLCNLRRYHSVIYGHRWWDYGSMLEVVDKMFVVIGGFNFPPRSCLINVLILPPVSRRAVSEIL